MLIPLNIKNIYFYLVLTLIFTIFLFPYLSGRYYTLIGFDAGFYVAEINRYLPEIKSLKEHLSIWHEPGGILEAAIFININGLETSPDLRIWMILLVILKNITLFLLASKLFNNKKKILFFLLITIFSNAYINTFYVFLYRQFFADIILLLFLYFYLFKKTPPLILGILLGQIYISHRGVSLVAGIFIFYITIYNVFYVKKALFLEKLGKIIAFSLLVSAPYFIISLPLNIEIVKGFYTGTKDASKGVYAATNQGVSIYSATPDPYGSNPISIVKNDPIILIISLLLMSSFRLFKKKEYLLILMIFPIYLLVSSNGPFSQRILYYLFLVYFLLFSSIIDNKKWVYIILTALLVFGVNYIGEKKPRMGGLNPEIYLQYLRNFDKEETLFITNGSQGVLIDELGWRTVPEEDLSLVSFKQDNRTIKNMLPFDIFYATGHKYPPTIENDGRTKSIYVIIPQGMIGKNTPGGEIKLENWNNSKYFQKVPDTPCSYGTGKIFCYMYKLNYLSINH